MLNLIKKDLIITKSYIIKVLAILLFYIFTFNKMDKQGISVISIYLIVYTFIAVSFYYGEGVKEGYMLKSLPVKKKEVVLAKYISVIMYFIASLMLIYIISFIICTLNFKNIMEIPKLGTVVFSFGVILVSMAIQLPVYFKFNHSKGRIINTLIYFCIFLPIYIIYDNNHLNNYIKTHNGSNNIYEKFIFIIVIVSIILFVISGVLSIIIYEKKESM